MRAGRNGWWVLFLVSVLKTSCAFGLPVVPCDQVHAAAQIARAKSLNALTEQKKGAPRGFAVEVVAAFRALELQPRNRAAAGALLRWIPPDEDQHEVILALDSAICDDESDAEIEALARVKYNFPRMVARAVELAPDYMQAYVNYALIALNPHSDYAVRMQNVCRNRPQEFRKAVTALSEADRKWFTTDVFDPKRCLAIAVPEAE
jgi:hypothetical protein